jgi:hypothetical protein
MNWQDVAVLAIALVAAAALAWRRLARRKAAAPTCANCDVAPSYKPGPTANNVRSPRM